MELKKQVWSILLTVCLSITEELDCKQQALAGGVCWPEPGVLMPCLEEMRVHLPCAVAGWLAGQWPAAG